MGRLNTYIHVHDESGQSHVFGPDDVLDVPDWAAERITARGVWAQEPVNRQASTVAANDAAGEVQEPPRSGTGSGKDAWAAFAMHAGVDISDARTREDIIAAAERAGVVQPAE